MQPDVLALSSSLAFLDELSERYRADTTSVDPSWQSLLDGRAEPTPGNGEARGGNGQPVGIRALAAAAVAPVGRASERPGKVTLAPLAAAPSVWPLVSAFRSRGHLAADL